MGEHRPAEDLHPASSLGAAQDIESSVDRRADGRRCAWARRPRRLRLTRLAPAAISLAASLILLVALLTSKGAHGIPGSAIVVLAATLSAVPVIPAIGLVLVLSVDWFMGMARALGNMTGNCVATVVIAAWEGDIDRERAHRVLDGEDHGAMEDALFDPEPEIGRA